MRKIAFTTFQDIAKLAPNKKIVFFGAGDIATKTLRKLGHELTLIVDNSPNLQGTEELNVRIKSPESLSQKEYSDSFVIICTTSFSDVAKQLSGMGLEIGKDFVVSPILNDLRVISELESCKAKILFTSGAPPKDSPYWGGGIYELKLNGIDWSHKKIYSGNCYGLMSYEDYFIAIDYNAGIIKLDSDYKVVDAGDIPLSTRVHGIAFSEITQCFYGVSTGLDQILIFDKKLKFIDQIPLSEKYDIHGEACHHSNDLCIVGRSLYVSMFSLTGNWQRDVFDGVVMEIDIITKKTTGIVISDLWMPHNIDFIEGSLVVLDSLRGQLKMHNAQVVGQFPGFSRGLGYDGVYYYIGQSRNRNYSKYLGLSNNISIDTSIIIFDKETKVSRSLQLPPKLSEIHSILLIWFPCQAS